MLDGKTGAERTETTRPGMRWYQVTVWICALAFILALVMTLFWIRKAEKRLGTLEGALAAAQADMSGLKAALLVAEKGLSDHQARLDAFDASLSDNIRHTAENTVALKTRLLDASTVEQRLVNIESWDERLKSATAGQSRLQAALEVLAKKVDAVEDNVGGLQVMPTSVADVRQEVDDWVSAVTNLESRVASLESRLAAVEGAR